MSGFQRLLGSWVVAGALAAQVRVEILPDEKIPERVKLENSGLRVEVSVGRAVRFTSFLDKATGIEFADPAQPAPVVNINHTWHLLRVGFNIWQVRRLGNGVEIELSSNYLENPYHVFCRLSLSEKPELELDLWAENRAVEGVHDVGYVKGRGLTAGLSFLHFLRPKEGGEPRVIFRRGLVSFHNSLAEPGMYFLRTPDAPLFPLVVSYPKLNAGLLLQREASDLAWSFDSASEARAFMRDAPCPMGASTRIFKGLLRPFQGDWHAAYRWWRERVRSGLDLANYRRAGHREYRKKVIGNFAMTFDHDLYDPINNRYRIAEFLERGRREFGGYDYVIFWHAYPRIGIDDRDQWAMYEGLPGGVDGVRKLVADARAKGAWIMLAFNPWDVIGRRQSLVEEQARIMARTGAQATYLDILREAGADFRKLFDGVNPDIVFSSENRPSYKGLELSTGSQAPYPFVNEMPRIDLLRFVVPEHNVQNVQRADRNREMMIRNSIFNFTGYTVWEDIFGEINRSTWQERVLVTRYNRLAHDHMDAWTDENPEPLIATREFGLRLGIRPLDVTTMPATLVDEDYTRGRRDPARIYVNKFSGRDKTLYTLWNGERAMTDRYHDNRIIGKLFRVDVPEDWRLVNIWDGLPARIVRDQTGAWAWVDTELPDLSSVFAAMPQRISVTRQGDAWIATAPGQKGNLRLAGMDTSYRPVYGRVSPAESGLTFRAGEVEPNVEGYVMVQLVSEEVVRDVAVVRVDR